MDKVNRIIVLIDFSEYSQNLINFAFNFSESIDAKLLFVHQYSAVAPGMADHETRAALARSAKEEAQSKLWSMVKDRAHSYQLYLCKPGACPDHT
ncbi:MAG: universal stress protein [Owenweeksia sp.]|nr:universal stress protein [Owenweeksia sp.]